MNKLTLILLSMAVMPAFGAELVPVGASSHDQKELDVAEDAASAVRASAWRFVGGQLDKDVVARDETAIRAAEVAKQVRIAEVEAAVKAAEEKAEIEDLEHRSSMSGIAAAFLNLRGKAGDTRSVEEGSGDSDSEDDLLAAVDSISGSVAGSPVRRASVASNGSAPISIPGGGRRSRADSDVSVGGPARFIDFGRGRVELLDSGLVDPDTGEGQGPDIGDYVDFSVRTSPVRVGPRSSASPSEGGGAGGSGFCSPIVSGRRSALGGRGRSNSMVSIPEDKYAAYRDRYIIDTRRVGTINDLVKRLGFNVSHERDRLYQVNAMRRILSIKREHFNADLTLTNGQWIRLREEYEPLKDCKLIGVSG